MSDAEILRSGPDVVRHLAESGRELAVSSDGQLIQCRYVDPSVAMPVAMRPVLSWRGSGWLAVGVPIGPLAVLRLRAALVANDELGIGALAVLEGLVVLRQTLRFGNFTGLDLDHTVRTLAQTAARMVAAASSMLAPSVENPYRYLFK